MSTDKAQRHRTIRDLCSPLALLTGDQHKDNDYQLRAKPQLTALPPAGGVMPSFCGHTG